MIDAVAHYALGRGFHVIIDGILYAATAMGSNYRNSTVTGLQLLAERGNRPGRHISGQRW